MIPTIQDIAHEVLKQLPYVPSEKQYILINALAAFVIGRKPFDLFLLYGYAGTGKTSLMAAFVKTLKSLKIPVVLLAPTGRAAKVFSAHSANTALTIHKRIYRSDNLDPMSSKFFLAHNKDKNTIFIVDEASMISDDMNSGSLLMHLVRHVYSSSGCNLILMGDTAQLPPVGQSDSPAMNRDRLIQLGLQPIGFSLDEPVRQVASSGILYNATRIRNRMMKTPLPPPMIWISKFYDVQSVSSEYLAEMISDSYSEVGQDETIVITRSNFRANHFNRGIRGMVRYAEEEIERGERLVVAKNNYFWTKNIKELDFIANGDILQITWLGTSEKRYGMRFADVELEFPNTDISFNAKILLDTLNSDVANMSNHDMNLLYTKILDDEEGELSHRIKAIQNNPYYNALHVKYAYCLTCHKAQGGQWRHVYIDMSGLQPDTLDIEFYRWLYTAITRASEKVFFINPSIPVK